MKDSKQTENNPLDKLFTKVLFDRALYSDTISFYIVSTLRNIIKTVNNLDFLFLI